MDKYLAFTASEEPLGFIDRFAAVGMDNPIDPAFIETLAGTLYARMNIDGRREDLSKAGETVSRAALAQMLYDQAGESAVTAATAFADVSPDASYAGAAAWAGERGFILGYGDETFGPDDPVMREQMAVILCRYAGADGGEGNLNAFADAGDVSGWAADAVAWASEKGILIVEDGTHLDPQGETTRVEAAAMLLRAAWLE